MALRLYEGVFTLLLLVLIISQIVIPFARGTRFFPMFRKRTLVETQVLKTEKAAVDVTELSEAQRRLDEAAEQIKRTKEETP